MTPAGKTTHMPAGQFKAVCLKVLDGVAESRVPVTITKRGVPVARLVPVDPPAPLFGALAGTVAHCEDLLAPIGDEWDALR
ncbi:type II toxin-antitoxin system Phd/YefM family antitoxin [Phytoactinopolyspora alkaliphila]|uniref:Type II toxin-antitoxin system Phd/YefM family antitoxin n=1 Tax=Phytoactinopolyspora alkaliphila TaxID=1783498 RepID=A0A6N9YUD1_9ACTN|nr:type II toxin-antitoxin system prevent-host-death family antitoxin [Phytoactinopolyspora alkaliphila]NED98418.1 type II toxin-antitoxin system Phd/YefM family antitoxin [Phytoactinopolyspora alkaliphila]